MMTFGFDHGHIMAYLYTDSVFIAKHEPFDLFHFVCSRLIRYTKLIFNNLHLFHNYICRKFEEHNNIVTTQIKLSNLINNKTVHAQSFGSFVIFSVAVTLVRS